MEIRILGVHPVQTLQPCYLIEAVVFGDGALDVGSITQPQLGVRRENWQVPYDEHRLALDGTEGQSLPVGQPVVVQGELRLAFFLHFVDTGAPLQTPAGPVALPMPTERPARLSFMRYEPP